MANITATNTCSGTIIAWQEYFTTEETRIKNESKNLAKVAQNRCTNLGMAAG